jgi:hypothetical protein
LQLVLWTDGNAVYIDVPPAEAVAGSKRPLRVSKATEIIAHLKCGHNGHDLLPNVSLIEALPQARSVPPMARQSIVDMRRTGMSMRNIYNAIKVRSHAAIVLLLTATTLLLAGKPF